MAKDSDAKIATFIEDIKSQKRVFLYGAGMVAGKLIECLQSYKIDNVEVVIVSDGHKKETSFMGFPIMELSTVRFLPGDCIVLAVVEWKQADLHEQLSSIELPENVVIYEQKVIISLKDMEEFYNGVCIDGYFFSAYSTLNDLGHRYGTDKAEGKHNYLHKYEFFLRQFQSEPMLLIELGVFDGSSIRMWAEYFHNGRILGVDIDERCLKIKGNNYECMRRDLSKSEVLEEIGHYSPAIIIDDASHMWSHQIMALSILFSKLKSGGIYIVEDIGTSFGKFRDMYFNDATISAYEFLSIICELVTGKELRDTNNLFINEAREIAEQVDMITFIYGSCIIVKR